MRDSNQDEIRYEPVPGFRTVFFLALALASGYLLSVFVWWL